MTVHCNAGVERTSTVGDFPGSEQDNTWLYPIFITNVLLLVLVRKWYCVTYNSALQGDPSFVLRLAKDRTMRFVKSNWGVYYYDMASLLSKPATVGAIVFATIHSGCHDQAIMVNTVEVQKELFNQSSVQDSKVALKLARVLFSPSGQTMEQISDGHWLQNSPTTCPSLVESKKIFITDLNTINGKTVLPNIPEARIKISNVLMTCSSPRQTFFLHVLSFQCTSKLCDAFLNQFSVYFHI